MLTMASRVILALFVLSAVFPSLLSAATERRTALIIGNSSYKSGPLKNPVNDATDMAAALKRLGFNVTLHRNANHQTMEDAIREFGRKLKRDRGVGLFYYAGHGMQIGGVNYLIPIGARVYKETDVKFQAINAEMILAEMEYAGNALNIVVLDACRDNPFGTAFRSASRGLAIISNAPTGTFISYSTGANQLAKDGDGRNSPYAEALITNIERPGLTINRVFMNVRSAVMKETGQVPWELSSLVGDFYFRLGVAADATPPTVSPAVDYAAERRKIEEERELLRQRAALEEERRKLEEERERLSKLQSPAVLSVTEIGRDGRFIAYHDGTVLDTQMNLMWAAEDNGSDINWADAKSFCENYRGGGYTDWRMPTLKELEGLYDRSKPYRATQMPYDVRLSKLIQLSTCCPWASETRGSEAAYFHFGGGGQSWDRWSGGYTSRILPVRSVK